MKKIFLTFLIALPLTVGASWYNPFSWGSSPSPIFGLATTSSYQTILPFQNNAYDIGTSTKVWRNLFIYNSSGALRCLQVDSVGLVGIANTACGSGSGGSGGGSWATTTAGSVYFNYSLNDTDVVGIGSTSGTSTASYFFDPNIDSARIGKLSTASTTILGSLFLPSTSQGYTYFGSNSKFNSVSTSTLAGQVFPFSSATNYNSTSTAIGFLNGLFSTASSTLSSNLFLTGLSQGGLYTGSNGLVGIFATGTVSAGSSAITVTAGRSAIGGALAIDCATATGSQNGCLSSTDWTTFNNKSGFAFPFDVSTNYVSTSSKPVGFLNGLFSTASSTFSSSLFLPSLSQGLIYVGSNSLLNSVATSSASCSGGTSCSAFTVVGSVSPTITSFSYPFPSAATNTRLTLSGGLDFPYSSSTIYSSFITASSTFWYGGGLLTDCTGTANKLTWNAGTFRCEGDEIGAGGTVDGTGVANTLAMWTDSNTLQATSSHPLYVGSIVATSSSLISTLPRVTSSYSSSTIYSSFEVASTTSLTVGVGSVSAPSISFSGDSDTGIYSTGANLIDIATGGVNRLNISSSAASFNNIDVYSGNTLGDPIMEGTPSVSAPAFSFNGDLDNGIYRGGADILSFATVGTHRMSIDASGNIGVATTTPTWLLNPFSSSASQLALSAGGGIAQWAFRNAGGNLYFSTTTVGGTATTSIPALSIIGSTGQLTIPALISCNTIDTDASGNFSCGTDEGGSSSGLDFSYAQDLGYGLTGSATSTKVKFSLGILASTTNYFDYASTTQLSIGSDYITDADGTGLTLTSGVLNCDTASGSVQGCLSSTDWTTFNNSLDAYDAWSHPQIGFSATTSSLVIATSTAPTNIAGLTISSTTASQLALSNSVGQPMWVFRNAGGNLYLSTTTVAGTATTSISALEISGSGFGTTTLRGLTISNGQATSTSNVGWNITGGCYAIAGTCIGGTGGSGTVTSVATDATLTGGPITTTGTLGLNLGNTNTWTVLQNFNYSSSTIYSSFINASSTNIFGGNFTFATSSTASRGLRISTAGVVYSATTTRAVSIFNAFTTPDTGGNSWFEPYTINAVNDNFKHMVGIASSTAAKTGFYGTFHVPNDYQGAPKIEVYWTASSTSGNAVFDFDYRAISGDDAESLDQSTFQESVTATDAAPSAINERNLVSMPLTASNIAAADTIEFYLARDGADASDTLGFDVIIHDVIFKYSD